MLLIQSFNFVVIVIVVVFRRFRLISSYFIKLNLVKILGKEIMGILAFLRIMNKN